MLLHLVNRRDRFDAVVFGSCSLLGLGAKFIQQRHKLRRFGEIAARQFPTRLVAVPDRGVARVADDGLPPTIVV